MGVKDLWNVLGPISHKKSLYDLQDKSVAVDLSCWVCEGQVVGEHTTQPRMYLRTLFFRTCTLLMMNINPIFVLDGEAPELKLDAMQQRNDVRFGRYRDVHAEDGPTKETSKRRGGRSRFKGILRQCKQMLDLMGVACIQSDGEAEALCAQLNRDGIVDAVITQDSDVFLYGADTVYRNLAIKSGSGTVDVYNITEIEDKLNLDRKKLVAMSVLCGCDYDLAGVHGVGKEIALKYVTSIRGDVLERLRALRTDKELQRLEDEKNGCGKCCHPGKLSDHKKLGCPVCGKSKGCDENYLPQTYKNLSDEDKKDVTLELNLRRKALQDPNFPNENTIKEYLENKQELDRIRHTWNRPDICRFVRFCENMLEWEMAYAFEKILPLCTRWLLAISKNFEGWVPKHIIKKRIVKGVACFDISWSINDENVKELLTLLPDDSTCVVDGLCVTTEPQVLISDNFHGLYSEFMEANKKKPVKPPRVKKSKQNKASMDDLSAAMADLSVNKPKKEKKNRMHKKKNNSIEGEKSNPQTLCGGFHNKSNKGDQSESQFLYDNFEEKEIFTNKCDADYQCGPDDSIKSSQANHRSIFSIDLNDYASKEFNEHSFCTQAKSIAGDAHCKPFPLSSSSLQNSLVNFNISFELDASSIVKTSSPVPNRTPVCNTMSAERDTYELANDSAIQPYSFEQYDSGTVVISDESTVDYDLSAIVDEITSRREFY